MGQTGGCHADAAAGSRPSKAFSNEPGGIGQSRIAWCEKEEAKSRLKRCSDLLEVAKNARPFVDNGLQSIPPLKVKGRRLLNSHRTLCSNYGSEVVQDRGGVIKRHHIDVWFSSDKQAKNWGKRDEDVTVCTQISVA
ncbi:3D domain-containing protein [Dyella mobilis]|uniref:3D domain-containing protein n=1 Tax=Dyella mobilis TaxID=1849582 RepID=A0ABS2KD17_9GAMM|nr:hypothetical protein [Dyella mobilis]